GRRVVTADPEAAAGALAAIEDTARSALEELDQLLAVLRAGADDGAGTDDAPFALALALDDVVAAHRRAGLDVREEIDLPPGLPALLGRTVRRVVTEALTNAHRHGGPGPVTLAVRHDAEAVHVRAANPVAPRRPPCPSAAAPPSRAPPPTATAHPAPRRSPCGTPPRPCTSRPPTPSRRAARAAGPVDGAWPGSASAPPSSAAP